MDFEEHKKVVQNRDMLHHNLTFKGKSAVVELFVEDDLSMLRSAADASPDDDHY